MDPGCEKTLEELKEYNIDAVKTFREQYINDGFMYNDCLFDSDDRARMNIIGVATLALTQGEKGGMPVDFTWRDAKNVDRPMSGMDITKLGAALFTQVSLCYYVYRAHKANIEAMNKIEDLIAYDCFANWPKIIVE